MDRLVNVWVEGYKARLNNQESSQSYKQKSLEMIKRYEGGWVESYIKILLGYGLMDWIIKKKMRLIFTQ